MSENNQEEKIEKPETEEVTTEAIATETIATETIEKEATKKEDAAKDVTKDEAELVRDLGESAIFDEEEPPKKKRFRFNRQEEDHFSRDRWILERIPGKDLMEYLRLEQARMDKLQMAKERRWKRINTTIRLVASLIAGVTAVYFLKDEPTILVNVLYICGILGGAWIWKNQKDKK